jgi:hypothetical protein
LALSKSTALRKKPEAKVPKLRKEMETHQSANLLAQKCSIPTN